ncbi:MAG: hypothetical protein BWK68_00545 [Elusimicrobia bacterium A5]|nr:MAG: hypothetical protein BWK68_00545 [Elusimicrobia bacterium A5]
MLKAKDVMTKNVVTIKADILLKDAIRILVGKGISGVPVVDDSGKVTGILSEKDIINYMFSGNLNTAVVSEAMTKNIISMTSDTDLDKVALLISEKKFRRVPIIDNGKLTGIISRRDIIRSLLSE